MKTADIGSKEITSRTASASGRILLQEKTIKAIEKGEIRKGDALLTAKVAAIQAVKKAHEMIPMCHPIPITSISVDFVKKGGSFVCECEVKADYRTGVEMEALVGVAISLLTLWDMVKYLEKDEKGQYPATRIQDIQVTRKEKHVIS